MKKDLSSFPFGDNTIVGDRGASLSGGQKARVNLARAVYSKNDCILLDDPFSPLDASVGRQVFDKCIMGILRTKAVLLVTHQLQFLQHANEIILLNNGKVESQGSYEKLLESGIDFAQLLLASDEGHGSGLGGPQLKLIGKTCETGIENSLSLSLSTSDATPSLTSCPRARKKPTLCRSSSLTFNEMNMFGNYSAPEEFEREVDEKSMSMSISHVRKQ